MPNKLPVCTRCAEQILSLSQIQPMRAQVSFKLTNQRPGNGFMTSAGDVSSRFALLCSAVKCFSVCSSALCVPVSMSALEFFLSIVKSYFEMQGT